MALPLVALIGIGGLVWPDGGLDEAQLRPPPGVPAALVAAGMSGRDAVLSLRPQRDAMLERSQLVTSGVLAGAIRASSAEAMRAGARPIPDAMAEQLTPHYGHQLVTGVHWTVRGQRLELGSLLTAWVLEEGAVTLGKVVVFDHEGLTDNLWLWAHELAHVEQYRRLGVDGFARAYLADWTAMEAEATVRGNAVVAAVRKEQAEAPIRWLSEGPQPAAKGAASRTSPSSSGR
ncbi:hypothetical protein GCM10007973_03420 [Polymorphobacter multimanifer]|uniref:eCIS core domain-containing protein n=1 Tax=Polymorphobacter multimanifer TaxID=1070431 RepID=A0A841L9H7_9SPHN|nr:hypothetical protein [Polymorphobacter multimanifer]GGI69672.1 hypothetical protein GCM10007973_03420 [Polymorphobacter multimanifer]